MDDLNVFRIFVAAVEAKSFAGAATTLGLSRSAVAKAVARLEERAGVRLFHRTTRVITLTDEGRALSERSAKTIAELEGALDDLVSHGDEPRGLLRLTAPDAYGRSHIVPVLARFLARWPRLEAEVNFSDHSVDVVAEGFDLALRIGARNVSDELVSRVVARYRVSLCASPAYLATVTAPQSLADLRDKTCLQFVQRGRALPWRFRDEQGQMVQLDPAGRVRFDNGEALRDAAVAGLGLVQLPDFLLHREVLAGRLQRLLEAWEPHPVPIAALYPSRKYLLPKVRLFIDALAAAQSEADGGVRL